MIILVAGRAGEGKSTFADFCQDILVSEYKISSAKVPFAGKVKETARFMGWDGEKDDKGRRLLQEIGNTGRTYDIDMWARHTVEFINDHPLKFKYVFVDDWRFPNEGKYLRKHFNPVVTVRVRRPTKFHTLLDSPMYNDVSETSLPDNDNHYTAVIENNETLEVLKEKAREFVTEVLLERGK